MTEFLCCGQNLYVHSCRKVSPTGEEREEVFRGGPASPPQGFQVPCVTPCTLSLH